MSWLFRVDFQDGSGWRDITSLVNEQSMRKKVTLWNDLKPVADTLTFLMRYDSTIVNLLLTNEKDILFNCQESSVDYFTGFVRPNFDISTRTRVDQTKIECIDRNWLLTRKIDTSFQYSSYKVHTAASVSTSIVHQLLLLAGLVAGDITPDDIDKTIDYFVNIRGEQTYAQALTRLLYEFGYVYYFDESGKFCTYDFLPTSTSTAKEFGATSSNKNIIGRLIIKKRLENYEGVDVWYWTHETLGSIIVFSETTNGDTAQKCNISVAAGEYYPSGSGTHDVFAEYAVDGREIITVTSPALDDEFQTGIVNNVFTNLFKKAQIEYENTAGSAKSITKLDITGNAIVKGELVIDKVRNIANTEKILEIKTKYLTSSTDSNKLASGLARYYRYSDFKYRLKSRTDYDIGDFVDIDDDYNLSIDNRCVIISKEFDEWSGEYTYELEGISEYTIESIATEGDHVQSPPIANGQVADMIDEVNDRPTYDQVAQTGFSVAQGQGTLGTKTPTVPTITVQPYFNTILIEWDHQTNLTNFNRYEIQVSDDDSTWYSLEFDGSDWKKTLDADTDWFTEHIYHTNIPPTGTDDNPAGRTLYYRVRRVTNEPIASSWSSSVSTTTILLKKKDYPIGTISADKMEANVINALLVTIRDALQITSGQGYLSGSRTYGDPDQNGDTRVYMDTDELRIDEYQSGWQNKLVLGNKTNGYRLDIAEVRALDSNGLKLYDDAGNGILIRDGGAVQTIVKKGILFDNLATNYRGGSVFVAKDDTGDANQRNIVIGRNIEFDGTNWKKPSDNSGNYWGKTAAIRFDPEGIEFITETSNQHGGGTDVTFTPPIRVIIDESGNVLIGTTNAHQLLTVNGNISMYDSGVGNTDRYIYFASDANIFWDETLDIFSINKGVTFTKKINAVAEGIRTIISTDNVSNPPTDAELDSAFGTPSTVGAGFIGILSDNGGTPIYICTTNGTTWVYNVCSVAT
jgi:hypothetical protein